MFSGGVVVVGAAGCVCVGVGVLSVGASAVWRWLGRRTLVSVGCRGGGGGGEPALWGRSAIVSIGAQGCSPPPLPLWSTQPSVRAWLRPTAYIPQTMGLPQGIAWAPTLRACAEGRAVCLGTGHSHGGEGGRGCGGRGTGSVQSIAGACPPARLRGGGGGRVVHGPRGAHGLRMRRALASGPGAVPTARPCGPSSAALCCLAHPLPEAPRLRERTRPAPALWYAPPQPLPVVERGRGGAEFFLKGGGGPGTQKSKNLCTQNSQINISFCERSLFPPMKSGSGGGGGGWHKALVVGSVSLWQRLLASRL